MTDRTDHELGMPPARYASLATAAAYLDCSEKTLRRRIASGHLTGYRIGRVIRVDLNEIDAMLLRGML